MRSAGGAVLSCPWSRLGCAQTQVAPTGRRRQPLRADAGAFRPASARRAAVPTRSCPARRRWSTSIPRWSIPRSIPCMDWYAHVCARWMAANPIPASGGSVGDGRPISGSGTRRCSGTPSRRPPGPDAQRSATEQKIGDSLGGLRGRGRPSKSAGSSPDRGRPRSAIGCAPEQARHRRGDRPAPCAPSPAPTGGLTTDGQPHPGGLFGFGSIQDYRDSTPGRGEPRPGRDGSAQPRLLPLGRREDEGAPGEVPRARRRRSSASPAPPRSAPARTGRRCSGSRPRSPARRWTW